MRRSQTFGVGVWGLLPFIVLFLAAVLDSSESVVVPVPPPSHVEWVEYEVGGMILVNPANQDSSGVMTLPRGSLLQVPQRVAGEAPDTLRARI